jgi:hypothetical protein
MHRSVVPHHRTAWCRNQPATSRCTAGSVRRWPLGRGGTRVTGATSPALSVPLPPLQPDQNAVGQHDGDCMTVKAWPQPALVLVPAQLALGLLMKRLARMPPMGHGGQLLQRGLRRQVAPELFTCPGRHAPPPASPRAAARHWLPAHTARARTSCAATLWSPAASG